MKKIAYLSVLALGVSMAACTDYHEPNPTIPSTEPEMALNAAGVSIQPTSTVFDEQLNTLNIEGYEMINYNIPVVNIEIDPETFNQAYHITGATMQMTGRTKDVDGQTVPDFDAQCATVPATVKDNVIYIDAATFSQVYQHDITKSPEEAVVYTRYALTVSSASSSNIRLGGDNQYYGPIEVKVLPVDLFNGQKIDKAYYLIGTCNDWSYDAATLLKLEHDDNVSPYDNPVFYTTIDIDQAGWDWQVVPASAIADGQVNPSLCYGPEVEGDTAMSGDLVQGDTAGQIAQAGSFMLSFDMAELTYSISATYAYLTTPGAGNGWTPSQKENSTLTTQDFVNYYGYVYLGGEWKIAAKDGWDINWGGADGILSAGGSNLKAPEGPGLYFVSINLPALTYNEPVLIESVGLIGGFNSWGAQEPMVAVNDEMTIWEGTLTVAGKEEFKIRMNDNWDYNLGGDPSALTINGGDNLVLEDAGTYKITLDMTNIPYTCTILPAN